MGQLSAALFVFEHENQGKLLDTSFLKFLTADAEGDAHRSFSIPDLHHSLYSNPTGFDILTIYFSSNLKYVRLEDYNLFLKEITLLGIEAGAIFAFTTEHEGQLEEKWLEDEILCPILAGNGIEISHIGAEAILLSKNSLH